MKIEQNFFWDNQMSYGSTTVELKLTVWCTTCIESFYLPQFISNDCFPSVIHGLSPIDFSQNHHLTFNELWKLAFISFREKMSANIFEMKEFQMVVSYFQILCLLYFFQQQLNFKILIMASDQSNSFRY